MRESGRRVRQCKLAARIPSLDLARHVNLDRFSKIIPSMDPWNPAGAKARR
jgi:hypothetical protein